ncbi:PEP-CTERM sorting domain-containing protein [bacterium]|nr:PEP-CTERM sorting domain-containing protein [bacterium]
MSSRAFSSHPNSLKQKIAAYSVAGATIAAGGINMAEADIVDSTTVLTIENLNDSFDVDVDGNGTNDFNVSMVNTFGGVEPGSLFATISGLNGNMVGNLTSFSTYASSSNFYIGAQGAFSSASQISGIAAVKQSFFYVNGGPFVGLQFNGIEDNHFGGAFFEDNGDGTADVSFQWEQVPDQAFVGSPVAAVPEPSSLALLALGATGLAIRRRKKKRPAQPSLLKS